MIYFNVDAIFFSNDTQKRKRIKTLFSFLLTEFYLNRFKNVLSPFHI